MPMSDFCTFVAPSVSYRCTSTLSQLRGCARDRAHPRRRFPQPPSAAGLPRSLRTARTDSGTGRVWMVGGSDVRGWACVCQMWVKCERGCVGGWDGSDGERAIREPPEKTCRNIFTRYWSFYQHTHIHSNGFLSRFSGTFYVRFLRKMREYGL